MKTIIVSIVLALTLISCSSTQIVQTTETTVRDTLLTVVPPAIRDILNAHVNQDSSVTAYGVRPGTRDTVSIVHYYPKDRIVTLYVQPDTVRVPFHDTLTVTHNEITEKPPLILEVLGYIFGIVIAGGIIVLVMKFRR